MTLVTERPPVRPRPGLTGWFLLAALVVIIGAVFIWWLFFGGETLTAAEEFVVSEPVATIVVDSDAGSIIVVGSSTDEVRVERTVRTSGGDPELSETLRGDTLTLTSDCPAFFTRCSVQFEITAPHATAVDLRTSAGEISVTSISGEVEIDTNAGSIRLDGLGSRVDATSNAGAITGERLTTGRLRADTAAGSIHLVFDEPVDDIEATTNAGSVTIEAPGGPYDVDADTNAGRTRIEIATDPDAPGRIVAHSNAGNVTVTGR